MIDATLAMLGEFVFYGTARIVLPLLTFGRVRAERMFHENTTRIGWLGAGRDNAGRWVLSGQMAALFGCVFWVVVVVVIILLVRR